MTDGIVGSESSRRIRHAHQQRAGPRTRRSREGPSRCGDLTDAGWAFFNVNGYLGTVTEDGDVVTEDQFLEDE